MNYGVGDEVSVTITGTIVEVDGTFFAFKDKSGAYMNFDPETDECIVEPVVSEPDIEDGLYQDTDGEMFLRQGGEWLAFCDEGKRCSGQPVERFARIENLPNGRPW